MLRNVCLDNPVAKKITHLSWPFRNQVFASRTVVRNNVPLGYLQLTGRYFPQLTSWARAHRHSASE
jgi:hypothetical protein